ncbi:MAG: patatin-like phospholipase family protein [Betaproteobacteria bacterium]|jgi:NTE family protein|nr:patatin-like phospholipase family protein [Betaproteobacteria bacterium]
MTFINRYFSISLVLLLAACASAPPPVNKTDAPPLEMPAPAAKKNLKLGLALGGGAARGFAHIGVLQVLEEEGIKPQMVVGTSAGSVVAAFYASGKTGQQLQWLADTMDESQFTDWANPFTGRGMLRGEALGKYINSQLNGMKIEDMKLPLGIVATDLRTGDGVLFRRGDVATAVRASSAVPSVFEPVRIAGKDYVDGGLVSPVPVRYAKQMGADLVLAIDISSRPEDAKTSDMLKVLLQTFSIMGKSISQLELVQADVVVRPALPDIGSTEFSARKKSIEAGRAAMKQALPQLKALLAQ